MITALLVALAAPGSLAGEIQDAIDRAADDLVNDQTIDGNWVNSPVAPDGTTGESVAGLVRAYELTDEANYKAAAQFGATYCLYDEGGYHLGTGLYDYGLYGVGAYALTRVSDIQANPASNTWRTAVDNFYEQVRTGPGTQNYIDYYFSVPEDTSAVYDVARHTMAAYYVNATDKGLWRQGLIDALADVDDGDDAPVMALGSAIWGLAWTGPMDATLVSTDAGSTFNNVPLSDLPDMLVSHQTLEGDFYTLFDHSAGPGYTETTVMAALGMEAAYENDTSLWYGYNIRDARNSLTEGVDPDGQVYWKINDYSEDRYYFLAGETLEVLRELLCGDATEDGWVGADDLAIILTWWGTNGDRRHGDLTGDGFIGVDDYVQVLTCWGQGTFPGEPAGVPEPASLALLGIGGLALLARRTGRNRKRISRRHSKAIWSLTLVAAVVLAGFLCVQRASAAPEKEDFFWGGWAARRALRFDPFRLTTAEFRRSRPGLRIGQQPVVPVAVDVPEATVPADPEPAVVEEEPEVVNPQPVSVPEPVAVPYRPPLRSPYRPPLF